MPFYLSRSSTIKSKLYSTTPSQDMSEHSFLSISGLWLSSLPPGIATFISWTIRNSKSSSRRHTRDPYSNSSWSSRLSYYWAMALADSSKISSCMFRKSYTIRKVKHFIFTVGDFGAPDTWSKSRSMMSPTLTIHTSGQWYAVLLTEGCQLLQRWKSQHVLNCSEGGLAAWRPIQPPD